LVAKPFVVPPARRPPERSRRAPGSSRKLVWSQNLMRGFPRGAPRSAQGAPQEAPGGTFGRKTLCGASRAAPPGAPQGAPQGAPGARPGALQEAPRGRPHRRFCDLAGLAPARRFFVFTLRFFGVHSAFFMCSLGVLSVFTRRFFGVHSAFFRCSLCVLSVFTRRFFGVHSAFFRRSLCDLSVFTLRFLAFTRRSGGRKLLAQHCGCRALRGREACDITSSPTRRDRSLVHIAVCALWIEGVFGELSSLSLLGLAAKASATLSPDRTYFTSQCRLET